MEIELSYLKSLLFLSKNTNIALELSRSFLLIQALLTHQPKMKTYGV